MLPNSRLGVALGLLALSCGGGGKGPANDSGGESSTGEVTAQGSLASTTSSTSSTSTAGGSGGTASNGGVGATGGTSSGTTAVAGAGGTGSGTTSAGGTGGGETTSGGPICDTTDSAEQAEFEMNVDLEETHQVIDGFGASDAWSIDPLVKKWTEEGLEADIEALADLLFDTETGIGLSAWRFNIGAGSAEQGSGSGIPDSYRRAEVLFASESTTAADTTKQSGQVRFLREAYERGVEAFVAFANSPPVYLTKNGLAHPGNGTIESANPNCPSASQGAPVGSTNLCPDKVDAFAEFLAKVLAYLRTDVGVPIDYLSPINEPTWDWQGQTQEGNRYNVTDMKAVYASVHEALMAAGLPVEVDGTEAVEYTAALSDNYKSSFDGSAYTGGMNGSGNGSYKNFIDEFLGDSVMRDLLGNKISMHGYFSDAAANRLGTLRDLTWQNLQEASAGSRVWMSEFCILGDPGDVRSFGGSGWNVGDLDYALHVGRVMHRDLTRLGASAWHWWLAVTPYDYKDGLLKINGSLDRASLETSKVLWTVGQYSRFVRPGFVRVELPGFDDLDGLMASAYSSADGSSLVVVVVNADTAEHTVSLNVSNASACFETFTTDATRDLTATGTVESGFAYALPARSTVSFVARLR